MTEREKLEYEIVQNKLKIDSIMQPQDGAVIMPHRALPYMRTLYELMSKYRGQYDTDNETDCMIYTFLADSFTYIPYLPLAVDCYTLALECAIHSDDELVAGEIPELVYKIAKYRNMIARDRFYTQNSKLAVHSRKSETVYDLCDDINTGDKLKKDEVRAIVKSAADTAGRALTACASEHSSEYLNCLYDMNETVLNSFDKKEREAESFCYAFWAAKKMYLKSRGIDWESPASLNPNVKFKP